MWRGTLLAAGFRYNKTKKSSKSLGVFHVLHGYDGLFNGFPTDEYQCVRLNVAKKGVGVCAGRCGAMWRGK